MLKLKDHDIYSLNEDKEPIKQEQIPKGFHLIQLLKETEVRSGKVQTLFQSFQRKEQEPKFFITSALLINTQAIIKVSKTYKEAMATHKLLVENIQTQQ